MLPTGRTYLYRCFCSHGGLLYVGIAEDFQRRLRQHRCSSAWWSDVARVTVVAYPSRGHARRAEDYAIKNDQPIHNVQGRPMVPSDEEFAASVNDALPDVITIDITAA